MVVAILTAHAANGFFMNWFGNQKGEGFEYHLLAIGLALALETAVQVARWGAPAAARVRVDDAPAQALGPDPGQPRESADQRAALELTEAARGEAVAGLAPQTSARSAWSTRPAAPGAGAGMITAQ